MKIIKLDSRFRYRRKYGMQYAIVEYQFDWESINTVETWMKTRYGSKLKEVDWISGFADVYKSKKYYIAFKDPAIITMIMLSFPNLFSPAET